MTRPDFIFAQQTPCILESNSSNCAAQGMGRRLAGMPDLDIAIAELDAMLAHALGTAGISRALLSREEGNAFLEPSRDDWLHVHAHLLQLVSQAPTASETSSLKASLMHCQYPTLPGRSGSCMTLNLQNTGIAVWAVTKIQGSCRVSCIGSPVKSGSLGDLQVRSTAGGGGTLIWRATSSCVSSGRRQLAPVAAIPCRVSKSMWALTQRLTSEKHPGSLPLTYPACCPLPSRAPALLHLTYQVRFFISPLTLKQQDLTCDCADWTALNVVKV